jgi:hypothetical protein
VSDNLDRDGLLRASALRERNPIARLGFASGGLTTGGTTLAFRMIGVGSVVEPVIVHLVLQRLENGTPANDQLDHRASLLLPR